MKARRLTAILGAVSLAMAPAAVNAASALSIARASAPITGVSFFQAEVDDDDDDDGSTAVILGVLLVVLIGAAAVSGGGGPSSP